MPMENPLESRFITFAEAIGVLADPEIFDRTKEDGATLDDLLATYNSDKAIVGSFIGNKLIGAWRFDQLTYISVGLHCHFLKGYREHAKASWQQVLVIMTERFPYIKKFNAKIPVCFPEVYHFSKNRGMRDEGIDRQSIQINGKVYDQWMVGGTKEEMINGCS